MFSQKKSPRPHLRIRISETEQKEAERQLYQAMKIFAGERSFLYSPTVKAPAPDTLEWNALITFNRCGHSPVVVKTPQNKPFDIVIEDFRFVIKDGTPYIKANVSCFRCATNMCDCAIYNTPFQVEDCRYINKNTLSQYAESFEPNQETMTTPIPTSTEVDWSYSPETVKPCSYEDWLANRPDPDFFKNATKSLIERIPHHDYYADIRSTADSNYKPTADELKQPHCTFCKEANEPYAVYRGHVAYGPSGDPECLKLHAIAEKHNLLSSQNSKL